ncbi:MAG TPA: zinc ABC transporter substrate-binding protein [Kiloniellales bacterium]|nr:zinc ABC transporter substrate-binding protein [Kiloniellales bacterium]
MRLGIAAVCLLLSLAGPDKARAVDADAAGEAPPRVVVSIPPLHSLVAGVMAGTGTPTLLLSGGASPHAYSLKPSDAQSLSAADLMIWVGPTLETFLTEPLESLTGGARMVQVLALEDLILRATRPGGIWPDSAAPTALEDPHRHEPGRINPHLWLDPDNAGVIAAGIARTLAEIDPGQADRYRANAVALDERLDALDHELAGQLAPLSDRPFLVLHDAFAYFEARYDLNALGALAVSPEAQPGARRVAELRAAITERGAVCVFAEPQFAPDLLDTLVADTGARRGTLDPLGADLEPGPELYFQLMRNIARDFADCLAGG